MDVRAVLVLVGGLLAGALRAPHCVSQEWYVLPLREEERTYTRVSDGNAYTFWPALQQSDFYMLRVSTSFTRRAGNEGVWSPFAGNRAVGYLMQSSGAFRKGPWAAFGGARYHSIRRDSVGGNLLAEPELFYPYLLADNTRRVERIESYGMYGEASYTFRGVLLGLGAQFDGTTHFSRRDPRVRGRAGDFSLKATAGAELLGFLATATAAFRRYFEPLSVSIERENSMERIYFLLGFGLYDHNLSRFVKKVEVHYLHTAWQGRVDIHSKQQQLPHLYVAYEKGRSTLITAELPEASSVDSERLYGALAWRPAWEGWALSSKLELKWARRLGSEIFYRWHQVNESPELYERREYNRVKRFVDFVTEIRGYGRVSYKASAVAMYAEAECRYRRYGSRYDEEIYNRDIGLLGYRVRGGACFHVWRINVDLSLYGGHRIRLGEAPYSRVLANRQEEFYAEWYDVLSAQRWAIGGALDVNMVVLGGHRLGVQIGGEWMRRQSSWRQGYMLAAGLWYGFRKETVEH